MCVFSSVCVYSRGYVCINGGKMGKKDDRVGEALEFVNFSYYVILSKL